MKTDPRHIIVHILQMVASLASIFCLAGCVVFWIIIMANARTHFDEITTTLVFIFASILIGVGGLQLRLMIGSIGEIEEKIFPKEKKEEHSISGGKPL